LKARGLNTFSNLRKKYPNFIFFIRRASSGFPLVVKQ
jgi:hypothetical protein